MSDTVILGLIGGFFALLTVFANGFVAYKLKALERMGQATHTLVNNQHAVVLLELVGKSERIYEMTKTADDLLKLEHARRLLAEHMGKQDHVNQDFTSSEQQKMRG
jgi:hypothetical protein